MVKYLNNEELEKVKDNERREYFRYINNLRKHQKNMKYLFTIIVIFFVLIVSGLLLYNHYNRQTMVLVLISSSDPIIDDVSKRVLINNFNKLDFDENNQFRISLDDLYSNKYDIKINKLYRNNKLCSGYVLVTRMEKYYQIDATHYCE